MLTVLAMGQSNAIGRNAGGASFADISSSVSVWNNASEWGANGSAFVFPSSSAPPFGTSGENNAGIWFSHRLSQRTGLPVRHVLVARGARGIEHWVTSDDGSDPGMDELSDVVTAIQTAGHAVKPFDVFLWQGSESNDAHSRVLYRSWWNEMVARLEADGFITPSTPVIIAPIAKALAAHIDAEHQAIAAAEGRVLYAPGFTSMTTDDGVHWTGKSQVTMGASMFCVWQDWVA